MTDLDSDRKRQRLHHWEIGKTLDPERGPESPGDAVTRLWRYFERLESRERDGFVAALVAELVALKLTVRVIRIGALDAQEILAALPPPRTEEQEGRQDRREPADG